MRLYDHDYGIAMSTSDCPCELPTSGVRGFWCDRLGVKMTPHWCHLYQTRENYRRAWDEGRGPGQRDRAETGRKKSNRNDFCNGKVLPIAQRLAVETRSAHVLTDCRKYLRWLSPWAKEGYPVRTESEQVLIVEDVCPACSHYNKHTKTCGRCGARGQLIAVIAYMATTRCPIRNW